MGEHSGSAFAKLHIVPGEGGCRDAREDEDAGEYQDQTAAGASASFQPLEGLVEGLCEVLGNVKGLVLKLLTALENVGGAGVAVEEFPGVRHGCLEGVPFGLLFAELLEPVPGACYAGAHGLCGLKCLVLFECRPLFEQGGEVFTVFLFGGCGDLP